MKKGTQRSATFLDLKTTSGRSGFPVSFFLPGDLESWSSTDYVDFYKTISQRNRLATEEEEDWWAAGQGASDIPAM
jgi:hypothetical protein